MRELNPRAWIPSLNRYATGYDAVYYHCQMNNENGEWWCYPAGEIIQLDVEIELPTGLKDVNGNEITEGDILEDGEGEPFEYWVVKFKDGKFVGETQGVTEDLFELTDLEIVGTIREHPEFLEEKE